MYKWLGTLPCPNVVWNSAEMDGVMQRKLYEFLFPSGWMADGFVTLVEY